MFQLEKVPLNIFMVKTIRGEDCKKRGMLNSNECSYVTSYGLSPQQITLLILLVSFGGGRMFIDTNKHNCYSMWLQYFIVRTYR